MAGEMLEFQTADGAVMGQVFNLEQDTVGAVIYGDYLSVKSRSLAAASRARSSVSSSAAVRSASWPSSASSA